MPVDKVMEICHTDDQWNHTWRQRIDGFFDKKLINIILLGLGFMFSMGSCNTTAMSQTVILRSVDDDYYHGTSTSGYLLLCVVYGVNAISFLFAPSVSAIVGPKIALVLGSAFLLGYVATFLRPIEAVLYIGSVAQGIGQGLIWTVYGHFFSANSNKDTLGRNAGIFWCIFQSSLVFGNLFYFLTMRGVENISENSRLTISAVLVTTSSLGIVTLSLLRHPWREHNKHSSINKEFLQKSHGPLVALVGMAKMAVSKKMLLLIPAFFYMGLDLSFYINVYGTSLGYTEEFGELREGLVGLNGIFIGVGQISGGLLFMSLGTFSRRRGRDLALVFGMLVHFLAYYLVFLNLPTNAPLMMTSADSFFGANPYIAMFCSFLLGLGDAAWNNQVFALLGTLFPAEVACVSAFAIFQFMQGVGASVAFFYTPSCTLPTQLMILVIVALLGTIGFCIVEWETASLQLPGTSKPGIKQKHIDDAKNEECSEPEKPLSQTTTL